MKSKAQIIVLYCGTILLLSGCVAPVQHNTGSGKPEICISSKVPQEAVASALTSDLLNRGYSISQQTNTQVRGDKPVTNVLAAALLGSRYDSTPNARINYNIVSGQDCTRVVADMNIVTNPGSAFERLTAMSNSQDSVMIQSDLNQIKETLEQQSAKKHTKRKK
jgi:hypothetical protein